MYSCMHASSNGLLRSRRFRIFESKSHVRNGCLVRSIVEKLTAQRPSQAELNMTSRSSTVWERGCALDFAGCTDAERDMKLCRNPANGGPGAERLLQQSIRRYAFYAGPAAGEGDVAALLLSQEAWLQRVHGSAKCEMRRGRSTPDFITLPSKNDAT